MPRATRNKKTKEPSPCLVVGGISRRVWLNKQSTTQFYSANGNIATNQSSIGEVIESVHFENAAAYVDKSGQLAITFNDSITYKLNGVTGYL